jgi:hypothetical protein
MTYSLFIDDERWPPSSDGRDWKIARDHIDVLQLIKEFGDPEYISFDHDLGPRAKTGFEIAKMLVEMDMDGMIELTDKYYVHSQNYVGKDNIEGYLEGYRITKLL